MAAPDPAENDGSGRTGGLRSDGSARTGGLRDSLTQYRHTLSLGADSLMLAAGLLVLLTALVAVLPVPYVTLAPGNTYNTIGSVGGVDLIQISGTTTYPVSGHLDLTTVSESGGSVGQVTVGEALHALVDPTERVLPRSALFGDDQDAQQVQKDQTEMLDQSENSAIAAAMGYLGKPVTTSVRVAEVGPASPSAGVLSPGDVIQTIDGTKVDSSADVGPVVRKHPPGTTFTIAVLRDGAPRTVQVTSAPRPDKPDTAYLGIVAATDYVPPFPIEFGLKDVGGPSAGTMLALGIIDKLTPGGLNGGRFVAGTGTISPDGQVGAIGGIAQKMVGAQRAGAELFLAPTANCEDVAGHVPDGLTVAAVGTLAEAVHATEAWVAGRGVPACPSR